MRRHFAFAAILLIAACSHKSADDKLLDAADPAASWTATLQLTAEEWLANSAPSSFARATIKAANKEFDKTGKAIAQSEARPELRDAIKHELEIAQAAAGDFKQAIETNDRRTVADCARRLALANSALQRIEKQKSGS